MMPRATSNFGWGWPLPAVSDATFNDRRTDRRCGAAQFAAPTSTTNNKAYGATCRAMADLARQAAGCPAYILGR